MPEPRSSFSAFCHNDPQGHEKVFIFGGAGENNAKYNDLWVFDGS